MTKPGSPAKKAATPARKVPAAPKPRPGAAAIEQPAAKKRAVAATKPAAEKAVRTVSEASEDDGAFEALVLDADDDEDVPAGDEENVAEDGNEEDAAASRDENDEEGDAEEPLGGAEVAEDDVEGWVDEAAEGDLNEEGGEVEYEEGGDHIEAVDVKAEVGLEGDAERDNAPGEDASDGDPEASAGGNEGAEPQANGVKIENGGEEDTAAAGEGETIVRDLAPSERDFVMAEDEEVKEEPTREVSRLWDLCPDVELEQAETITASLHESIRRSVRQFIERLLRVAKETGGLPEEAIAQDDQPMFGCSLCNVKMHKPELFDTHVGTQRHVKRLRWMYFMGMNKELGNYHCRVCQISVPCRDHLVGHLRSDRHLCLSKSLNVHPKYSEHVLLQFYPEDEVKSLLQPQPQQQQQQQPSATTSQPLATGKGKGQKSADKRPDKGKANAGSTGQQSTRDQSPPASASQGFIFHCEVCQVIAYHEDQIQEHYKGKKHRAKMAEELEKLSKQKPDDSKKGSAKGDGAQAAKDWLQGCFQGSCQGPRAQIWLWPNANVHLLRVQRGDAHYSGIQPALHYSGASPGCWHPGIGTTTWPQATALSVSIFAGTCVVLSTSHAVASAGPLVGRTATSQTLSPSLSLTQSPGTSLFRHLDQAVPSSLALEDLSLACLRTMRNVVVLAIALAGCQIRHQWLPPWRP
ncbi:hypothetical protein MRX96_000294 [Rhipicephalus microplus]